MPVDKRRPLMDQIREAGASQDLDTLKEMENLFELGQGEGIAPLAPEILAAPDSHPDLNNAGPSRIIEFFNKVYRTKRKIAFLKKMRRGEYSGPIIVSEGDSWFQYPKFLEDIIDVLNEDYAICSLGGAGHHIMTMERENEYTQKIRELRAHYFLLSGGGNDLLAKGRLFAFLRDYQEGMTAEDVINWSRLDEFLDRIKEVYWRIIEPLVADFEHLRILIHGYDFPIPRPGGSSLGKPLERRGVPQNLWNEVMQHIMNRFNINLIKMQDDPRTLERVFYINCRGQVGDGGWHDELHPKDPGYAKCAALFKEVIERESYFRYGGWFVDGGYANTAIDTVEEVIARDFGPPARSSLTSSV